MMSLVDDETPGDPLCSIGSGTARRVHYGGTLPAGSPGQPALLLAMHDFRMVPTEADAQRRSGLSINPHHIGELGVMTSVRPHILRARRIEEMLTRKRRSSRNDPGPHGFQRHPRFQTRTACCATGTRRAHRPWHKVEDTSSRERCRYRYCGLRPSSPMAPVSASRRRALAHAGVQGY